METFLSVLAGKEVSHNFVVNLHLFQDWLLQDQIMLSCSTCLICFACLCIASQDIPIVLGSTGKTIKSGANDRVFVYYR